MRKIISTALLALLMVAACANPQISTGAETASITVSVSDASAKTIAPETSSATHYRLSLDNAATGTHAESGFLAKGESFVASDVSAGIWIATADAYIKTGSAGTDSDYTKIATGTSAETAITGGTNSRISVVIDTFIDAIPGDISITLDVPFSSLEIYGRYSIKGVGQREGYSYQQNDTFVIPWNNPVLTIDTSEISPALYQGTYIIEITASSVEQSLNGIAKAGDVTGNDPVVFGAEAIFLLAGQESSGTIMLSDTDTPMKKQDQPAPSETILVPANFYIQATYIVFYDNPENKSSVTDTNLELGLCKKSDPSTISWTSTVAGENLKIDGLTRSSEYLVYARYPGNDKFNESQIIGPLSITTLKFDDPSGGPEIP